MRSFRECPVNIPVSKDYKDRRQTEIYLPASTGRQAVVQVFVRSGKLIGRDHFILLV